MRKRTIFISHNQAREFTWNRKLKPFMTKSVQGMAENVESARNRNAKKRGRMPTNIKLKYIRPHFVL